MKRLSKLAAVAVLGGSLLAASSAPATASEAEFCRGPYGGAPINYLIEDSISCTCILVATVGQIVLPDSQWQCP